MPTTRRSIVMVDWARQNEPTARNRDQFLWDLMLLSLLYDDVFVQDEIIVCSKKMPRWFPDSQSFRLLEETIECGGFGLLKRPRERYPEELQELAGNQPITARRQHLHRFSVNNDGEALDFDDNQHAFHNRLEAFLKDRPSAHRYAGLHNKLGKDIMQEFSALFAEVLTNRRYQPWLRATFPHITTTVTDDILEYVTDPSKAIKRLHEQHPHQPPRYTPRSGTPVFDTALAVQVAATFPRQAEQLQDLIETVFARPFCQDEGADGRYGKKLRDLPAPAKATKATTDKTVRVETQVAVPMTLPYPGKGFSKIIATVRGKESGKQLRTAMRQLGSDLAFAKVKAAWFAVADDIASMSTAAKMRKINLSLLIKKARTGAVWGVVTDLTLNPPRSLDNIPELLASGAGGGALHGIYSLGGNLYSNLRADIERDELRQQLEQSVNWACVPHPTVTTEPTKKQ